MRAKDLTLDDVLTLDPDGGPLFFVGERVLLVDALAEGLVRKGLVDALGLAGARAVLSHAGFAHGWKVASAMKDAIAWDGEREWRIAGGRLHRLHGLVTFEPPSPADADPTAFAEAWWHDSYEAEQHLLHFGRTEECVCWTLVGFASGYLSRVNGRSVYCVETQCRAQGAAACRMVGRLKEDWGEQAQDMAVFEAACLKTELRRLTRTAKRREPTNKPRPRSGADGLVARSAVFQAVLEQARRSAQVSSPLLLVGERGVGKARLARSIHDASARLGGPFVTVPCGSAPPALVESELWGHARGAFAGATTERFGAFEAAQGGTLFLADVSELSPTVQAELARVLSEGTVRRLGDRKARPVDVRVIASTRHELPALVRAGRFDEQLLYRLRVVELRVPPLRERPDDVPPLAKAALEAACARAKLPKKHLRPDALRALLDYRWPGNVRELENAMERAALLAPGAHVRLEDLPDELRSAAVEPRPRVGQTLAQAERALIFATLAAEGGHRNRTAARLGIGPATLFRKLKLYADEGAER